MRFRSSMTAVRMWLPIVVLLTGCQPLQMAMMVNPRTGDVVRCEGKGNYVVNYRKTNDLLEEGYEKCMMQLRNLGYKPAEELTPEEKTSLPRKRRRKISPVTAAASPTADRATTARLAPPLISAPAAPAGPDTFLE